MISVVYLARGQGPGLSSAKRFFDSYDAHRSGLSHSLIVLAKAWTGEEDMAVLSNMVAERGGRIIQLPDDGFDWGAYIRYAQMEMQAEWLFFLGSNSIIQCSNWLLMIARQTKRRKTAIAGASGSWAGMAPIGLDLRALWRNRKGSSPRILWRGARHVTRFTLTRLLNRIRGPSELLPFPNPHIRSNAFLVSRELFADYTRCKRVPASKMDCYLLESGKGSLTRFAIGVGYVPIVVGRNNKSYEPQDWVTSNTFWCPDQPNLIVADNQTEYYRKASIELRHHLERSAWGRVLSGAED